MWLEHKSENRRHEAANYPAHRQGLADIIARQLQEKCQSTPQSSNISPRDADDLEKTYELLPCHAAGSSVSLSMSVEFGREIA